MYCICMENQSYNNHLDSLFRPQPQFEESERRFFELLPELIEKYRGLWIAIAGNQMFMPPQNTKAAARSDAIHAGYADGEYTVRCIVNSDNTETTICAPLHSI